MRPSDHFFYGRPVPPASFVGRREVVRAIFGRLLRGESIAVVGPPKAGKSSLLSYLAHHEVCTLHLGGEQRRHIIVKRDCAVLQPEQGPEEFWRWVCQGLPQAFPDLALRALVDPLRHGPFDPLTVEEHLRRLGEEGLRVVLLLDDFDTLLDHPRLSRLEFLGALRSFRSNLDALAVVLTSSHSLAEMQRRAGTIGRASAVFSDLIEVFLEPLQPDEAAEILKRGLEGTDVRFTPSEHARLEQVSGHHPYLLQAAAASLFEAHRADVAGEGRWSMAIQRLQDRVGVFCNALWDALGREGREVALDLAAPHRVTRHRALSPHVAEAAVNRLLRLGLLEPVPNVGYRLRAGIFAAWLSGHTAALTTRDAPVRLFCSFHEEDGALWKKLRSQLSALEKDGTVELWEPGRIRPGEEWQATLDRALESAEIIAPLLSAAYLASTDGQHVMRQALSRYQAGSVMLILILLRPAMLEQTLNGIPSLPGERGPVSLWPDRDHACKDITEGLLAAALEWRRRRP